MAHEHVVAGIAAALAAGALTADAVAVEARKAAQADSGGTARPDAPAAAPAVTSLTDAVSLRCPPIPGRCPRSPPTTSCCAARAVPHHPVKSPS